MKVSNGANGKVRTHVIEHGVPLPEEAKPSKKVLFKKMKQGDSVLLPAVGERGHNTVSNAAYYHIGKGKYTVRRIDAQHVRVWRTA